jgi:hypothetical protein
MLNLFFALIKLKWIPILFLILHHQPDCLIFCLRAGLGTIFKCCRKSLPLNVIACCFAEILNIPIAHFLDKQNRGRNIEKERKYCINQLLLQRSVRKCGKQIERSGRKYGKISKCLLSRFC